MIMRLTRDFTVWIVFKDIAKGLFSFKQKKKLILTRKEHGTLIVLKYNGLLVQHLDKSKLNLCEFT